MTGKTDRAEGQIVVGVDGTAASARSAGAQLLVLGTAYPPGQSASEMPGVARYRTCCHDYTRRVSAGTHPGKGED